MFLKSRSGWFFVVWRFHSPTPVHLLSITWKSRSLHPSQLCGSLRLRMLMQTQRKLLQDDLIVGVTFSIYISDHVFLTVTKQQRGLNMEAEQENNMLLFIQVAEIRFIVHIVLFTCCGLHTIVMWIWIKNVEKSAVTLTEKEKFCTTSMLLCKIFVLVDLILIKPISNKNPNS